jgi:hypothetical protein
MTIYTQFNQQREAQIKQTFDAKMHKIDKLKTKAPTEPEGEAQARAERHRLRVAAAEEFCDARRILHKVYGLYPETHNGK